MVKSPFCSWKNRQRHFALQKKELFCCWMWGCVCLLVPEPAPRLRRQPVRASQLVLARINMHVAGVQTTNHGNGTHKATIRSFVVGPWQMLFLGCDGLLDLLANRKNSINKLRPQENAREGRETCPLLIHAPFRLEMSFVNVALCKVRAACLYCSFCKLLIIVNPDVPISRLRAADQLRTDYKPKNPA